MSNIKVSVIVPIYNVEEYLEECLMSLVKQTLEGIEVLMIDDGSTDHSAFIAKRFEEKYSNFHYFYKENGGLGNARNYAIPYVKGEYLIFLDSDDVVPEYAYEKMYNLAIKTGNDMIIGNVKRFNSTKVWDSGLHKKVFDDAYEHTHILEKPELVYDTTSWNKLFKTSFYKKNNFQFPEKILYEDIPVTIPAHFKANSVGIITDICYLWRTRDGVSKSITQNRTEVKNFTDRIKIMDMVNSFYDQNVTDRTALLMKDYKWLDVDLKLYVNQFPDASDEYRKIATKEIQRYLDSINPDAFQRLRSIDKMKYYYINKNKIDRLLDLLEYQKTTFKSLSIHKKQNSYIGNFPMKDIPDDLKNMTKELEFYPPVEAVRKIEFSQNTLKIQCVFYISRLKKQDDFEAKAYLYNKKRNQKIPLNIIRKSSKDLTNKRGYRFCRKPIRVVKYDYSHCAYEIMIDLNNEKVIDLLKESCFIQINYTNGIINQTFLLGKSDSESMNLIQHYGLDCSIIKTHLMNNGNLQIQKEENILYVDKYNIEKGNVVFENIQSLNLYHNYLNIECNSMIPLKDLDCGTYDVLADSKFISIKCQSQQFKDENNIYFIENGLNGNLQIKKYVSQILVDDIQFQNNKIIFDLQYSNYLFDEIPSLVLSNKKYNYDIYIEPKEYDKFKAKFLIQLDDSAFISQLANGEYTFTLHNKFKNVYPLKVLLKDNVYKYKIFDRILYFSFSNNEINLKVDHEWKAYENTRKKRRILKKYIYPLLRLLPLNKKTIIFEGWWGAKYHCNPKYLYEYINKHYPKYRCIWFLNDNYIPIHGNAKRVRRKSLQYYYYLSVGKYFVNNVNFHDEYVKRKGQIEIQTMHGTPLKTLGLDVPGELDDPQDRERFLRRRARWDYLVVQSHRASQITSSCYAYNKEFLRTGYPRNDILFEKNNLNDINKIKEKMGIPLDKKVLMYAPTWRKRNFFDMHMNIEDMKKALGDKYILILRIHPFAYKGFDETILNDFVYNFSTYESVEELYLVSDIVITDYSSVMFDYTILNRPILFYTYDLKEYRDYLRGFNFDFEKEAPGPLIENYEELKQAILDIENVSKKYDNALQKFRKTFNEYEKGTASEQIFKKVFEK